MSDEVIRSEIIKLASTLPEEAYVWKARLNFEEYSEIKTLVETIFASCDIGRLSTDSSIPEFKKLIKYYIAEWYKREYNGQGISPIIPSSLSTEIVEHYKIDHVPVVVRTQWQACIRALGGLPVYYLLEKHKRERNDLLLNKLSALFDPDDSQDFDVTEELFNDKTINRSDSIRHLIPELQNGQFPYDENDKVNGSSSWTFKDFSDKLNTGFEQNKKRKFVIEYRFWQMPGFTSKLTTCIRFKPNAAGEGRNFAINEDRLKSWGIDGSGLDQFTLLFECGGQSLSVPFFKCLNGDWIPYKCDNAILTQFPLFKDIHVKLDGRDLPPVLPPSRNKGCIQLYSDDRRSWSSRGGSGRYSMVVFDRSLWNAPDSRDIEDTEYEFVELVDGQCELTPNSGGAPISFYNAEGRLSVHPKHCFFQEGSFLGRQESRFRCKVKDQDDLADVYVVDASGFAVGMVKSDGQLSPVSNEDYQMTVFDRDSSRFLPIPSLDTLRGYHSLRIKSYEKTADIKCFFVPPETRILRRMSPNSREGTIELVGLEDFVISIRDGMSLSINNNRISCRYDYTRESPSCPLQISDEMGNNLLLDVVWPYDMTDLLHRDDQGTRLYRNRSSVPAILAHRYVHRVFSKEGCRESTITDDKKYEIYSFIRKQISEESAGRFASVKDIGGYARISLYSKTIQKDDLYSLIVDCGNEIADDAKNLKFHFVPIDEGDVVELPLKTIINDSYQGKKKYLILDIPQELSGVRGLIIQSLNEAEPEEYFRACYKPSIDEPERVKENEKARKRLENQRKYEELFNVDNPKFSIALRAFNIANDLGCYFGWFDELKALCSYDQAFERRMTLFFKQYLDSCAQSHKDIDYNGLWRFSGEFMFDWVLLPATCWRDLIGSGGIYAIYIRKLFLSRPGLKGAARAQTEMIHSLITGDCQFGFQRSDSLENRMAQCIRRVKTDVAQIEYLGKKKAWESFLSEKDRIAAFNQMTDFDALKKVYGLLSQKNTKKKQ